MEIEELQKIWNQQKGETMYVINRDAVHQTITRKKNVASRKIDVLETCISLINGLMAIVLFIDGLDDPHYWDFVGSGMMLCTVLYTQYFRWKRKKEENTFDRSVFGELNHAISNTNYIIKFSFLMIVGYLVPFTLFYAGKMIDRGASIEKWLLILSMYLLAFLLIRWERTNLHIPKKRQLEKLRDKLKEEY
ncbi:MAG: hypothetical protein ABJP45_12470 [Cyclobacteriaceae bacterium]